MDNEQTTEFEYIKMDYSIENPADRVTKVEEIISSTPPDRLTDKYINKLTQYILDADKTKEKKKKKILTDNRMITINKRETSYEGMTEGFENGEDGIYNLIANDKNIIFQPKVSITRADVDEVPGLAELRDSIDKVEEAAKKARGAKAYALKKQVIEMRQQQYILKNSYRRPIYWMKTIKSFSKIDLSERIYIDEKGKVKSTGLVNFYDENHVSALLCNYSKLKEDSWSNFVTDAKWMMLDFEKLVDNALKDRYPIYYDIVILKIDGLQNTQIQERIEDKYGKKHSVEYISSLWRKKIPKLIVEQAEREWLEWHYTMEERGQWKRCSRCGQIKLADNRYFSKNSTSKDNFYSICKECRNSKSKKS